MPKSVETNMDDLRKVIKSSLPLGMTLRATREEPIAFGLVALLVDIQFEERDKAMDEIESLLQNLDQVSQVDVTAVSKLSTGL